MLESVKIYTSDKFWSQILTDLGAVLVDNIDVADVNLDNVKLNAPVSVAELKKSTGLKDAELNMGLGWLFCEDKLYVKVETVRKKETELIGWK